MINGGFYNDRSPRSAAPSDELSLGSVRSAPEVGRAATAAEGLGIATGLIGAAALGGLTILGLAHNHSLAQSKARPVPVAVSTPPQPRAPTPALKSLAASLPTSALAAPLAPSPILVVDSGTLAPPAVAASVRAEPVSTAPSKPGAFFSQDEQFAAQTGQDAVPTSHVQRLGHPDQVIAQGAVIPAILETALNSDLPGYARALVGRDVRSYDGSKVLIPRGSRLVGQYKSAPDTGQSRMLIVWTRLLRPDGVTIQLGSPTTDVLGEAGLSGKVDRHFLRRYGSAILLSLVGGLASAGGAANTVVIGTATQGTSAATVALQNDVKIPPTVRVPQGAPIQVFVARDLDFSEDAR